MNSTFLAEMQAESRRRDLLAAIEQRRIINEARAGHAAPNIGLTRRLIGHALVRAGERIGGTDLPPVEPAPRYAA